MTILNKFFNLLEKYIIGNIDFKYGNLYKLKNEILPFRYIFVKGDHQKGIHRFKHHQLKEYIFYDFNFVEREANQEEARLYNLIKEHVNEISNKSIDINNN